MKTTKLKKVIRYINNVKGAFFWKQFVKKFGPYPNTNTNYLRMLVVAGYVYQPSPGAYVLETDPIDENLTYSQLRYKAYGLRKKEYQEMELEQFVNDGTLE